MQETPILISTRIHRSRASTANVCPARTSRSIGPPGTGKSQMIAKPIATAIVAAQRVLFVAEKLTALEAVEDPARESGARSILLQSARTGIEVDRGQAGLWNSRLRCRVRTSTPLRGVRFQQRQPSTRQRHGWRDLCARHGRHRPESSMKPSMKRDSGEQSIERFARAIAAGGVSGATLERGRGCAGGSSIACSRFYRPVWRRLESELQPDSLRDRP